MSSLKSKIVALLACGFLTGLLWLGHVYISADRAENGLPLQASLYFCVALVLISARMFDALPAISGPSRKDWLQRAAVYFMFWSVWMALYQDIALPSLEMLGPILGGTIFGLFIGYKPIVTSGWRDPGPLPYLPFQLAALVIATALETLVPIMNGTGYIFFVILLAMTTVSPGAKSWSEIKWHDLALVALSTFALMMGLFSS